MTRLFLSMFLLLTANLLLSTEVNTGDVQGVWTKEESPYYVNGNITIASGTSLIIKPGVDVVFRGQYTLSIKGTLKALGDMFDSIRFNSISKNSGWNGIVMNQPTNSSDTTMFAYVSFRNQMPSTICNNTIYAYGVKKLVVKHCCFTNNSPYDGVIYLKSTTARILNNQFLSNKISNGYGTIHLDGAYDVEIRNNEVAYNGDDAYTQYGGAIFIKNSSGCILSNYLHHNKATSGGAIAVSLSNSLTKVLLIENNDISHNTATGTSTGGGGLFLRKETSGSETKIIIRNNKIYNNSASQSFGGGIYCRENINMFLSGNLLYANSAFKQGGAIWLGFDCSGSLVNNTILNNTANVSGGGIFLQYLSFPAIVNTVLKGNTSSIGSHIYIENSNCQPNVSFSNIQGGQAAFGLASGVTFNGTYTNNIDADPLFTSNGNHPYSIQANSPCKNAGTPDTTGLKLPLADLAGFARVQDGRVDIGAYEYGTVLDIGSSAQKKSPVIVKSYPNPFNNRTQINFNLGDKSMVNLSVYNASGQKVKQLLRSVLSAGEHSIGFNADNLNTGVYFVRLKTADFSTETKVVLTK